MVHVITIEFNCHTKTFCEDVIGMDLDKKMTFYTTVNEESHSAYFRKGFNHDSWCVITEKETANVTVHTYLRGKNEAVSRV
jgi:hypothetical protein